MLLILFAINLNATDIIHFQEQKYINIIDDSIIKKGTLTFSQKTIQLQYKNSDQVLIYEDDTLTLKENNITSNIDLKPKNHLKMIFLLIEAIYTDNMELLKDFFLLTSKNNITTLKPLDELKNYIDFIEFKKEKTLDFISIVMRNQDKITIRQIDD